MAVLLLGLLWGLSLPPRPDAFYTATLEPGVVPGTLLRIEPWDRAMPAGSEGWRMLYASRDARGRPALASALLLRSRDAAPGRRPLLAWQHGTSGVAAGCAPSLLDQPFTHMPALPQALAEGWVVLATDYHGLGTAGMHPYLLGRGEGYSVLDGIRAALAVEALQLDGRVVLWGHSQGGHATLWAASLAAEEWPELALLGAAALAPATDLPALVLAAQATPVGKMLSAYIVEAYAGTDPAIAAADYLGAPARWLARDIARRCMVDSRALFAVAEASLWPGSLFRRDPASGPLGEALRANSPEVAFTVPVLLAQGEADPLVLPAIQDAWVARQCASAGPARIDYRRYPDRDHLSLVAAGSPLESELIAWTRDRLHRVPAPRQCGPGVP